MKIISSSSISISLLITSFPNQSWLAFGIEDLGIEARGKDGKKEYTSKNRIQNKDSCRLVQLKDYNQKQS
jgi:hypothetical protein